MRAFGVLLFGLTAIVAGLIGYQIGLTSTAADATRIVYVGGGFSGFGFLFFLFFVGFLFFAFAGRRRAWGGGHWGAGYGRGPWGGWGGSGTGPDASSDPRRQWIADFHKSLHEADGRTGEPTSPPSSTGPTTPPTAG